MFQRYKKRTQRELKSRLTNIMFFRILVIRTGFLVWAMPIVGPFLGRLGALIWLAVVGLGLKTVAENWNAVLINTRASSRRGICHFCIWP